MSTPELVPHAAANACADVTLDPAFDPETDPDWITYQDAAELTSKSTKTIARAVNVSHAVRGVPKNGRMYVSVTDLVAAGMASADQARRGGSPKDSVELLRLRQAAVSLREQLAAATATLTARDTEIERVCGQLREKDAQIARLMKILEQQSSRVGHP